jgi:predicted permease
MNSNVETGMLSSLRQDLRFSVRSLVRRPVFAIIATFTLALGIGGTTTIFSVVDGVLIRELPYRNASSLVSVWRAWPSWREQGLLDSIWDHIHFDLGNYHSIRDLATTLSHIEAHRAVRMVLTGIGRAEEASVGLATAGLFELLGVYPVIGRTFAAEEALPSTASGARVALLSHQLWVNRFGTDAGVIGRSIVMSGESYEVIGVLPAEFRLVSDMITRHENGGATDAGIRDVWIPLGQNRADCGNCLEVLARLVPGRTTLDARAEVQRLLIDGSGQPDQLARVVAHKERLTQRFAGPLLVLFGAAGVLLLIACLNVAGLLAGEATRRHQEMAVRSALGAGRARVARQLITESALLGLIGAAIGVVLSIVATRLLLSVAPPMPRLHEVGVNLRVLVFATLTGIITGVGFGFAPALSRIAPGSALQSRGSTRGKRVRYLHTAVVAVQIAFTVMLLIAGALLGRSLSRLMSVEPGFEPERLATFAFDVPNARATDDESIRQFQNEVVRVASGVRDVRAVSLTTELPFPGGKGSRSFALRPDGPMSSIAMWHRSILPNYHETMGISLLAGRTLSTLDGPGAPNAIVVSQSFAEQIWPGESPLGKRIYRTGPVGEWTVVGVVGDVRHKTLSEWRNGPISRTAGNPDSAEAGQIDTPQDGSCSVPRLRDSDIASHFTNGGSLYPTRDSSSISPRFKPITP